MSVQFSSPQHYDFQLRVRKRRGFMLRVAGYWWIIVSMIHGGVGAIVYLDQWQAIAQDGWFNAVVPDPFAPMFERDAAFWFMFLTPFMFLMGQLCLWGDRKQLTFPIAIGGTLLVTVIMGLFLLPISGFWLVLPPVVMMVWSGVQEKVEISSEKSNVSPGM
jgi:hypothetical protein